MLIHSYTLSHTDTHPHTHINTFFSTCMYSPVHTHTHMHTDVTQPLTCLTPAVTHIPTLTLPASHPYSLTLTHSFSCPDTHTPVSCPHLCKGFFSRRSGARREARGVHPSAQQTMAGKPGPPFLGLLLNFMEVA
ncbi:hypothetical protein HJG60_009281 [Phyllostomus discolor]|uniref:Uncharacterized protein n=1 Tax=Phyllostomus discolor TaxID=89673 RepID=A0A833YQR6_9CHIR|nr:hypothetical protein HJG60_009281 [Phyllostomus discolor]